MQRWNAIRGSTAPPATTSISRCWSTGSRPSASKASPSMSPTASSPRRKRKFIVADTPGHEQYTRNMATGASTADLAVVLVDARQRRPAADAAPFLHRLAARHPPTSCSPSTRSIWSTSTRRRFERIAADYPAFAPKVSAFTSITPIPMSARFGDNVTGRSDKTRLVWRPDLARASGDGRSRRQRSASRPFRFPVQYVNRPNLDFRGFAGTIASGSIAQGDEVVVAKSGKASRVKPHRQRMAAIWPAPARARR